MPDSSEQVASTAAVLPMFPLGSPLFPHMPMQLQVFEPRYRAMLVELIRAEDLRFGIVLIERGHEVGGGEHRFQVGTVAEVSDLASDGGLVRLVAVGRNRFRVISWLPDDPYPRAEVEPLADLTWDDELADAFAETESVVRRALRRASEFRDQIWSPDVQLDDEPLAAAWQLAAIAPLTQLDQLQLLGAPDLMTLLELTRTLTTDAEITYG